MLKSAEDQDLGVEGSALLGLKTLLHFEVRIHSTNLECKCSEVNNHKTVGKKAQHSVEVSESPCNEKTLKM